MTPESREAGVEAARKLVEEISNIDMPYEVDRCESYMCEHWASKAAVIIAAHTEAALAQVPTDLAGAEATNALLDEEVARLRAEIKRWKDTLEMELTHSQAWVAQAVRAERERAIGLIEVMIRKRNVVGYDICDFCGGKEFRWPEHHPECEHGQLLEALRREPTQ